QTSGGAACGWSWVQRMRIGERPESGYAAAGARRTQPRSWRGTRSGEIPWIQGVHGFKGGGEELCGCPGVRPSPGAAPYEGRVAGDEWDAHSRSILAAPEDGR